MESEIKILEPAHFQNSLRAKLVCHPDDNGQNLDQLTGTDMLTNFLDVSLLRGSNGNRWLHSLTISVTAKQSLHEVPFYLREYWMKQVKPAVEFLANNP